MSAGRSASGSDTDSGRALETGQADPDTVRERRADLKTAGREEPKPDIKVI
jgi:hypothetical protein